MESQHYPVVVVGAGPGGYPCAIRLAQLGVKTLCIEKFNWGGVCLNVGCIPSKALITASKKYREMKAAASMGLMFNTDSLSVDMEKTQEWKAGIVKRLTGGIAGLFKANGVDHMLGTVEFISAKELKVVGPEGEQRITCDKLVLAVGSRPREIANFSYEDPEVLDSTKALDLQEVPARLAVIGGGYIGLEMGMMLAKLNAEVTVIEFADSVLAAFDPQVVREIKKKMKKLGMKTLTGAAAQDWERTEDGIVVRVKQGDELIEVPADKVLVTVGRVPNSEQLAPLGLELDRGFVVVNEQQQTSVPDVYAIGDITGRTMLAHGATYEGELAAEVIAGHDYRQYAARTVPAVVFTDPEIATAGLQEHEATAKGYPVKVGKMPFAAVGRAMTTNTTDGFIKVVLDERDDRVLGITIVGPNASDLISEAALAVELDADAHDLGYTIHPHPTLGEGVMEAAKHAVGEAIHIANKR